MKTIETVILECEVLNIASYILSKFEKPNPRITLKNKCTLNVKMYFLCTARMFQFNSGFSNGQVAGYLFSHKISNDNLSCTQNFLRQRQKESISLLHLDLSHKVGSSQNTLSTGITFTFLFPRSSESRSSYRR